MASGGTAAYAQQAPVAPASLPNEGLPTREEVTRGQTTPAPADRPRLEVEGDIERSACALAAPAYKDVRITVTTATFNNLGPVDPADLLPAYQAYLGKDVPASAICDIRDAAATKLRQLGYLAAVQVPPQKIEGDAVKFEVLYARVVAVRVRGDAGRAENLIAGYLNKLTRDPVFNRLTAERYLLLVRDLPGYDVRLALRPAGTAQGELIGDVTVTRRLVDVDYNVQNYASNSTGPFGGQLRAQFYGLTGMGDRTSIALYSTADFKEQKILQLGHDMRVGGEGLTLSGRFTYAWTKPEIAGNIGVVTARTLFGTAEASYPLLRSQRANATVSAGLDIIEQTVRFGGTPISRDKLRVAYLRLDGDLIDDAAITAPRWRLRYTLEARQGLNIWGARENILPGGIGTSRADGDADGTVFRASWLAELTVIPNVTFSVAPRAQYSHDALMSFEEFSTGNYTIGRGYDPGTLIGDSGIGASWEARINRIKPVDDLDFSIQPFIFVDSAWVWNKGVAGSQRLTSVGGGVRTSLARSVRLDATIAVPTRAAGLQTRNGDVRFLVSLTTRLFPWGF